MIICILLVSCSPSALQLQARIADAIGRTANSALPVLVESETEQGNVAIDSATSATEANERLRVIVDRWRPFWGAWEILREAQGQWATLIEQSRAGRPIGALEAVRIVGSIQRAWCALSASLPPPNQLPAIPGVTCTNDAGVINE